MGAPKLQLFGEPTTGTTGTDLLEDIAGLAGSTQIPSENLPLECQKCWKPPFPLIKATLTTPFLRTYLGAFGMADGVTRQVAFAAARC